MKQDTTVYFDNAATTPVLPEVIDAISIAMQSNFGNPSSVHQFGRKAKSSIELVRKNIANYFKTTASQVIFTSGGTEANNIILYNAVLNLKVTTIITSKIEHPAVLNTIKKLQELFSIQVNFVALDEFGSVDVKDLEKLLQVDDSKKLVSLMLINNEIGNILPMEKVSNLCQQYHAFFHSDTTQAIGYYDINLEKTSVDFIVACAHKFHGTKGIGFLIFKKGLSLQSLFAGGGQEKGVRSGTESVPLIVGMGKALELAYEHLEANRTHILKLKKHLITGLTKQFPNIAFNGQSGNIENSDYKIINVRFPFTDNMFLFTLDINGIAASIGSACQSGATQTSHVLKEILDDETLSKTSVRFSFSKLNTLDEIDFLLDAITKIKQNKQ